MSVSIKEFSKIRLKRLLPNRDMDRTWGFEYLGKIWIGETHIFSHALRLISKPFTTKSIAIETESLSKEEIQSISEKLEIELVDIKSQEDLFTKFGEPVKIEEFTDDRKTYIFFVGEGPDYEIGFTILNGGEIVYFTMDTFDVAYNKALQPTPKSGAAEL